MRQAVAATPPTLTQQVGQLAAIRQELHEDFHQLQHRAWLLVAARHLQAAYP